MVQTLKLPVALARRFPLNNDMTLRFRNFERKILKSVAFMRIEGEDVEEKALQLSGTDVGGWTAIVKPKPKEESIH
ncbi:unnamed protein product [Arabidopsis lyrata]|nr:unnamed protein product [Arabidopsis lyrata]